MVHCLVPKCYGKSVRGCTTGDWSFPLRAKPGAIKHGVLRRAKFCCLHVTFVAAPGRTILSCRGPSFVSDAHCCMECSDTSMMSAMFMRGLMTRSQGCPMRRFGVVVWCVMDGMFVVCHCCKMVLCAIKLPSGCRLVRTLPSV